MDAWRRLACLISAVAATFTPPARALVFDQDDRVQVSTAPGSVYAPIGVVSGAPQSRYATATLVRECYALTSQHIFGTRESPLGKRVWFTGGIGSRHRLRSAGTVVAVGGMDRFQGPANEYEARARDWLLIRLDQCLGRVFGTAKLTSPSRASQLVGVQDAGFPIDRKQTEGLTIDPSCSIRSVWTLVWLHDCATRTGNSGGPIFRIVGGAATKHLEVYAIESGGWQDDKVYPFNAANANQATPASQILPYVQPFFAAEPR